MKFEQNEELPEKTAVIRYTGTGEAPPPPQTKNGGREVKTSYFRMMLTVYFLWDCRVGVE